MAAERVEGVREARFSFEEGTGVVTFDSTRTSPAAVIAELREMTGFEAEVVEGGS